MDDKILIKVSLLSYFIFFFLVGHGHGHGHGHVRLRLTGQKSRVTRTLQFDKLTNLSDLNLGNAGFAGQITSTQWKKLLNLENLDLSHNSLNGGIPVSLFLLPSLQVLQLSSNQFSGQLKEFSNISSYN
jgi:Leucine-rich repeat (LRR) protein